MDGLVFCTIGIYKLGCSIDNAILSMAGQYSAEQLIKLWVLPIYWCYYAFLNITILFIHDKNRFNKAALVPIAEGGISSVFLVMEYEVYGEQNLPVQQVGHPSLVKGKAEKKLLPFSKGGVPPRAGRRDQGTGLQKNPLSDSSYREGQKLN